MKFPFIHPTLYVKELTLKKVTSRDLIHLEEIASYRPQNDLNAQQLLDKIDATFRDKSAVNWGLFRENELLGTIGYYRGFENDIGEIGYVTREKFRNLGYTTRGISRIIDFGLKEMELQNIVAYTSEQNDISKSVLNKLDFEPVITDNPEFIKFQLRRHT